MSGQADYREAAVRMLIDYAGYSDIKLQVYPGRPRTLYLPTAFVDRILTNYTPFTERRYQKVPQVHVLVIHGLFDSKDTVAQKDRFVDGFVEWVYTHPHAAGANNLIAVTESNDLPDYVPEWIPPESGEQRTYYASDLTLEGFDST